MDQALLRKAVSKALTLRIKYWPNVSGNGTSLKGWRVIQPLGMYRHKGKAYYFAYFIQGSSVNGLSGYRVYLLDNIQEAEEYTQQVQAYALNGRAMGKTARLNPDRTFALMMKHSKIE
jgi:predicted DNA-binding transcriptional regulator YafY